MCHRSSCTNYAEGSLQRITIITHAEPNQIPPGGFPVAAAQAEQQALWQLGVSVPVILAQCHPTCLCRRQWIVHSAVPWHLEEEH
jgi:hypothetical protein